MPDTDANLVVIFKNHAEPNPSKSMAAGRLICDDVEVCEIRAPAARSTVSVHPATERSHWAVDPETGGQIEISYAERFARQYKQFKARQAQTVSGTPLANVPFLSEGRRAELRALNVYTVEALAALDGQELKNIGQGGRDLKNAAMEFIEKAKANAPSLQLQAEVEALRAQNAVLQEDLEAAKNNRIDSEFQNMTVDALRDYITANTGHPPAGTLPRKSLIRMAMDAKIDKAA